MAFCVLRKVIRGMTVNTERYLFARPRDKQSSHVGAFSTARRASSPYNSRHATITIAPLIDSLGTDLPAVPTARNLQSAQRRETTDWSPKTRSSPHLVSPL